MTVDPSHMMTMMMVTLLVSQVVSSALSESEADGKSPEVMCERDRGRNYLPGSPRRQHAQYLVLEVLAVAWVFVDNNPKKHNFLELFLLSTSNNLFYCYLKLRMKKCTAVCPQKMFLSRNGKNGFFITPSPSIDIKIRIKFLF